MSPHPFKKALPHSRMKDLDSLLNCRKASITLQEDCEMGKLNNQDFLGKYSLLCFPIPWRILITKLENSVMIYIYC